MTTESAPGRHSESVTRAIEQRREPKGPPLELVGESDIPVAVGGSVGGRYVVDGMLAAGGMGVVCVGTHTELQQKVAIKFLRESYARSDSLVQRFLNEARAAAVLKSENVVRVMDVGQMEDGRPFLVMEHLEGEDLEALLVKEGPLAVDRAVRYALEVCNALEEAHSAGIIHRDIKPENLFLATSGSGRQQIKVVDFGLAKRIDAAPLIVTGPQDSMGSPCYMSPEQITTPHEIDARTDIWSLGCVLYRMLTMTMPFDGSTVLEVYARVLNAQPRPLRTVRPDLDRGIETIVHRCLEKDPKRRYQTIAELAAALGAYQAARTSGVAASQSVVPVVREPVVDEPPPFIPRRRGPGLFTIAAVVLIASFCGAWSVRDSQGRTEARAMLRGWVEWAMPRTSGGFETALEKADLALTPMPIPEDEAIPNLGDRYAPLLIASKGIVARHPFVDKHGQVTIVAEREHELTAVPDNGTGVAPSADSGDDDSEDPVEKQKQYVQFLETQRSIAKQVDQAQNATESAPVQHAPAPVPPRPARPSVDDLKAP
ncbi:MAG TPA: serine/threonine-protein kinase [Polyangiaceae bacterium]|jgi:predicted Ser/Thr protein kinase|nr:serine/threonine-protein kinase [Polyangiaceae bacterium]